MKTKHTPEDSLHTDPAAAGILREQMDHVKLKRARHKTLMLVL